MAQDEVMQISVGNSPVGIMGLKIILKEMAEKYGNRPDRDVLDELLNRLGKRNHIPEKIKENHGRSFLRKLNLIKWLKEAQRK